MGPGLRRDDGFSFVDMKYAIVWPLSQKPSSRRKSGPMLNMMKPRYLRMTTHRHSPLQTHNLHA
jgi:hypothetical protein